MLTSLPQCWDLVWTCVGLMGVATVSESSYVYQFCWVWKTLILWVITPLVELTIFLPPFPHSSLSPQGEGGWALLAHRDSVLKKILFSPLCPAVKSLWAPIYSKIYWSVTDEDGTSYWSSFGSSNISQLIWILRCLPAVFQTGCTSLHSYYGWMGVPLSSPRLHRLLSLGLLLLASLTGVRRNTKVTLICIFLVANDVGYF